MDFGSSPALREATARLLRALGLAGNPQYAHPQGLGRVALVAAALGGVAGAALGALALASASADALSPPARAACAYAAALAVFHLLEFFLTAAGTPAGASADSFLVNHSWAYRRAFTGNGSSSGNLQPNARHAAMRSGVFGLVRPIAIATSCLVIVFPKWMP